jgi:hypothetical protein
VEGAIVFDQVLSSIPEIFLMHHSSFFPSWVSKARLALTGYPVFHESKHDYVRRKSVNFSFLLLEQIEKPRFRNPIIPNAETPPDKTTVYPMRRFAKSGIFVDLPAKLVQNIF